MVHASDTAYGDGDLATAGIKRALADTRPWVFFVSILVFIACGVGALVCLVMLFAEPLTAIFSIPFVALYFFAGYHLYNYAGGIKMFLRTGQSRDLQTALTAQKSFWKLLGIVLAISMAMYAFVILAAIVFGPRAFR
jgi:hypothetical protein